MSDYPVSPYDAGIDRDTIARARALLFPEEPETFEDEPEPALNLEELEAELDNEESEDETDA